MKKTRRRYLALKIDSVGIFNSNELMDAVWNALLKLYGEYGASRCGLKLIDYDGEKRLVVVRTLHTEAAKVRAALASVTKIREKQVAIHVLTVSGTIKALYRKIKP